MKITEMFDLLVEAPLPEDWDSDIFNQNVPFSKRVKYAKDRAAQVGKGSSRVVFEIPYQGRRTALKIAMNRKGAAQSEEESQLFKDWYIQNFEITIPMIDYDEASSHPTWIHTEFATKITQKQLERYFGGVSLWEITSYLDEQRTGKRNSYAELPDEILENEYFQILQDLVINFNMPPGDLQRKANWGIYNGKPVIIDLGLTTNTEKLYRR